MSGYILGLKDVVKKVVKLLLQKDSGLQTQHSVTGDEEEEAVPMSQAINFFIGA